MFFTYLHNHRGALCSHQKICAPILVPITIEFPIQVHWFAFKLDVPSILGSNIFLRRCFFKFSLFHPFHRSHSIFRLMLHLFYSKLKINGLFYGAPVSATVLLRVNGIEADSLSKMQQSIHAWERQMPCCRRRDECTWPKIVYLRP